MENRTTNEDWELEDAPWEIGLASSYREVVREIPSPVLERCADRLEGLALDDDFEIVEEIPPTKGSFLGRQLLSGGIDAGLILLLLLLTNPPGGVGWAGGLFGGIAAFVYLTLGAFLGGRTLGDRLVGIRMLPLAGERLGLGKAALRAILAMLGILSLVGLVWPLVDTNGQSLHDRILGIRLVSADQP